MIVISLTTWTSLEKKEQIKTDEHKFKERKEEIINIKRENKYKPKRAKKDYRKTQKPKKSNQSKTIKYVIYMKDGSTIECKNINKNGEIIIMNTTAGTLTNRKIEDIKNIEEYKLINNTLKIKNRLPE